MNTIIASMIIILAASVFAACRSPSNRTEQRPYIIGLEEGGAICAITAKNNEELWRSPIVPHMESALLGYEIARAAAVKNGTPSLVDEAQDGFRWLLHDRSGRVVAVCSQPFKSSAAAVENYRDTREAMLAWPADEVQVITDRRL